MAAKQITWLSPTQLQITLLDGPAKGNYRVDVEKTGSVGETIPLGHIVVNGVERNLAIKSSDVPGYNEHYRASPRGLRSKREYLQNTIRGILDETAYQRERAFERDTGAIPSYDSPEYRAAVQALADWDAAHPEVIAKIKAEEAESLKRHEWD